MPPEAAGPGAASAASRSNAAPKPPLLWRAVVAFGRFWWDFLVGDTPELLIGVLVALTVVALLVRASSLNAVAVAAFPVMVVVLLGLSIYHARPKR
jgi:hypothetical protein